MTPTTLSVTLTDVTPAQFESITRLLQAEDNPTTKTKRTRSKPEATVSDDEDEDFGKKPLKAKDLEDEEELEASDDSDEDETDTDSEDDQSEEDAEESGITFQEVRAALNKYGEKHPDQARAILAGFNIKSPKELSADKNQKYWEPVYRKVMAKIKAAKKAK